MTPIKAVVRTIKHVFPSCRIFREMTAEENEVDKYGVDFANVVVFCTKTGQPVTFRTPVTADMLNSRALRQFLLPVHEVVDSDFRTDEEARLVRNNDTEQLAKYHKETALGHWSVMRRVLPATVWVNW